MADERDRGLHRHGEPDPSNWDKAANITDKPQKTAEETSTFASRAKANRPAPVKKAVESAENKSVKKADSK